MPDRARETFIPVDDERIRAFASSAEGRLHLIGALLGPLPLRALNDGAVWVVAVVQAIHALTTVADGDTDNVAEKWAAVVIDAPPDYVVRVRTALEEA